MANGIQHRNEVGALLRRAVDQAAGVQGGVAPVRADFVVEIAFRARPIPKRDHHITLDPLRAHGYGRQPARDNAVSPIGKFFEAALRVEAAYCIDHLRHRLPRLDSSLPGLDRGFERSQRLGNRAGRLVAELMASEAAIGLDDVKPLLLALDTTDGARTRLAPAP